MPQRSKLEIDEVSIEEVMRFKYLGVEIISYRDLRQGNTRKKWQEEVLDDINKR